MPSRWALAVVAVLLVVGCGLAAARPAGPGIDFADGTPADLRTLATRTWARFTDAFGARSGCLEPVEVAAGWRLADRGRYEPGRGLVIVRAPGTPANLRATLLHEFAHHLEFTCPEHRTLRPAFLAATGRPATAPWFAGERWDDVPSERFAEAAAAMVLGRMPSHVLVLVRPEEIAAVRAWAAGD